MSFWIAFLYGNLFLRDMFFSITNYHTCVFWLCSQVFAFREVLKEKYDGKLSTEMAGAEYEIISRIMKALVNRKITVPGSYTS